MMGEKHEDACAVIFKLEIYESFKQNKKKNVRKILNIKAQ